GVLAYAATIPAAAVGPRGIEYWARINTRNATLTNPALTPFQHPLRQQITVLSLADSTTYAARAYHMWSAPLALDFLAPGASLEALFSDELGAYDRKRWRAFRWLPSNGGYAEITDAANTGGQLQPLPGRGFWLI